MLHAMLVLAAETAEKESSKAAFYIFGGLLAVWAVVLSGIGLRRPEFPGAIARERGVIAITAVLVAGAMATAVITA